MITVYIFIIIGIVIGVFITRDYRKSGMGKLTVFPADVLICLLLATAGLLVGFAVAASLYLIIPEDSILSCFAVYFTF